MFHLQYLDSLLTDTFLAYNYFGIQENESATRSVAIINETSNMTSYMSRLSYAVAVNVKELSFDSSLMFM